MTKLSVEITEEQGAYISYLVSEGVFSDAGSVMREALAHFHTEDQAKLIALRAAIQEGIDSGIYEGDPFADIRAELGWTS